MLHGGGGDLPLVLLTTDAPTRGSAGAVALAGMTGPQRPIHDVVEIASQTDHQRLRAYADQGRSTAAR